MVFSQSIRRSSSKVKDGGSYVCESYRGEGCKRRLGCRKEKAMEERDEEEEDQSMKIH